MPAIEQTAAVTESRNFKMHPELLWSVIKSQAGTREKALLESVMNAVDAGATRCDIYINEDEYTVKDDGRGFQSRQEIENFFETFGTPHAEGDADYGTYRMGRGQLFAFSRTLWRSAGFSMDVDIKTMGLSYDLKTDLDHVHGCTIEGRWHERIDRAEVIRTVHDLAQLAQWMQITVEVNGKKINKIATEHPWDVETDDAYIAIKKAGGLEVYNRGAMVKVYPGHQFGLSGTIVTKVRLQVNFARNDILLSECLVWKRIKRQLDTMCGKLVNKKTLTDYERDALARRFSRKEIEYGEVRRLGLLIDVSGNKRTLSELASATRLCVVSEHRDWAIGERVLNQKLAFVIRSATLDRFGVDTAEELLTLLRLNTNIDDADKLRLAQIDERRNEIREMRKEVLKLNPKASYENDTDLSEFADEEHMLYRKALSIESQYPHRGAFDHLSIVGLVDVAKHINDTYDILEDEGLSPHQKAMLAGLRSASTVMSQSIAFDKYRALSEEEQKKIPRDRNHRPLWDKWMAPRAVMVGRSDVADAWTDGESYIAFNLDTINTVLSGGRTISSLAAIMIHEYCHLEPDLGGHVHSSDFYQLFHEYVCDSTMEHIRYHLLNAYAKAIASLGKKPNAALLGLIKADSKAMGDAYDQIGNHNPTEEVET